MLRFIKRLLGIDTHDSPSMANRAVSRYGTEQRPATDAYFPLLDALRKAKKERDWRRTAKAAHHILDIFPAFVREQTSSYGLPPSLPVFTDGARAFVLVQDRAGIDRLAEALQFHSSLESHAEQVEDARLDFDEVRDLLEHLSQHPGTLQSDLAGQIEARDSRRLSVAVRQLADGGIIQRRKERATYALGLPGAEIQPSDAQKHADEESQQILEAEPAPPISRIESSHSRRGKIKPRRIDLTGVEYLPLPRAPLRWEAKSSGSGSTEAKSDFEVSEGWSITSIEKLPMDERPDTAFRHVASSNDGAFLIDDLGKAEEFPTAACSIISFDRHGREIGRTGLAWDLYRSEVAPLGRGLIALDRSGIVHAYRSDLSPLFAADLQQAPETSDLMRRFQFDPADLKNHTRSVALSPSQEVYLFTVVDSVFLVGVDGTSMWGASLPHQDGWKRVGTVTNRAGTSADVDEALGILDLRPPFSSGEVKAQYRKLAKRHHPDLNQGSVQSKERFQALSAAAELLSGLDVASLAPEGDVALFTKSMGRTESADGSIGFELAWQGTEKHAADWIYASTFAPDGSVFLAGYSGRVVRLDPKGTPVQAYDIGAVPRRIVDTGDYLYFLTDTRLYVLSESRLVRLLDVFEQGELIVGQEGFGLLDKKCFRWFGEAGNLLGRVTTKRPIRRVYPTPDGLVVETRMRRAKISGPPGWWPRGA